ncbi:MAG: cadherin domain-containing protein, partial [Thiogranum sp.]
NSGALDFETTPIFTLTLAAIDDSGAYTSATVTINLNNVDEAGVNDAPFNTVPGAQTIDTDGMLLFSSATGKVLSVNDFDAGSNPVQVTLTATNGTLNLASTNGLSFSVGDGTSDATMTFTGTIADINAALEGATFVATAGFTGMANVQIITDDLGNTGTGGAQSDTDSVSITVSPSYQSLLLTTTGSATSDASSGSVSWNAGDLVELGDPGLTLEPVNGTTSGTFSSSPLFSLDAFAGRATNLNGIHYVTGDIAVGSNSLQLQADDILFVTDASETLTNSDLSTLAVTTKDIVAFRPTTPGDYSAGDFFIVVRGADIGLNNITAFSLVEQDTVVGVGAGSTTLNAGEFIVVHDGAKKTLQQLTPGILGGAATNTGTTSLLVDGAVINIGQDIYGLELIESDTSIGGVDLQAGQILVTLKGEDSTVGDNNISTVRRDIFLLDITQTGATTVGDATLLFEGNDVGLDAGNNNEDVWGISMAPNQAPTINNDTQAVDENSPNGTLVTTVTATDPENAALTYAITAGNTSGAFAINATTGQITVANSAALDFETTPTFTLTIAAIDDKGAYDAGTLTINLNDLAATITAGQSFSLAEDAANSDPVGIVATTGDPAVSFSITAGNTDGVFAIDNSGNLTVANAAALDFETTPSYTLTIETSDGTTTVSETVTVSITNVNEAPVLTDGSAVSYSEGNGTSPFLATGTLTDADSADFDGGSLTYSITSGGDGTDTLRLGILNGVTVSSNNVYVDGVLVGTQSGGTGGTPYTIGFTSNATPTRVETLFQTLIIVSAGDNPTIGVRNLEVVITDGDGGTSNIASATADMTNPVNDDPFNAGTLPSDVTVTEDVATNIDLSAIDFADPDANGGVLTVTLSTSTGGQLALSAGTGITLGGTPTATTVTGTLADLNVYFDNASNISYLHSTANFNGDNADSLTISIVDNGNTGAGGGGSINLGSVNIDISAVTDLTATDDALSTNEDTALNADVSTNDSTTSGGALTYAVATGASNGSVSMNADGTFTYTPTANYTGSDSFTYTVTDAGSGE